MRDLWHLEYSKNKQAVQLSSLPMNIMSQLKTDSARPAMIWSGQCFENFFTACNSQILREQSAKYLITNNLYLFPWAQKSWLQ
jgi:hypothetical protein